MADTSDPAAAAERMLRRLEARGLRARLESLAAERRTAPRLVDELLAAAPSEARAEVAARDPRLANPEVVWRLLEMSRQEEAATALSHLALARIIAGRLAETTAPPAPPAPAAATAATPATAATSGTPTTAATGLSAQIRIEVACETARRHLDSLNHPLPKAPAAPTSPAALAAATAALAEAAALLQVDQGYGRAVYCRAMAQLCRAEQRWEEALALGERAVRQLRRHGTAPERAAAVVELGWLMLEAGDADEAVPLFRRALAAVETVPFSAIHCRLGLAVALVESCQASDASPVDQLLVDAEWMISQTQLPVDPHRLRALAAYAAARCSRERHR